MVRLRWVLLGLAFVWGNGCSCSDDTTGRGHDQGVPDMPVHLPDGFGGDGGAGGDFVVTPPDVTLDCNVGQPSPSQTYTATTLGGVDVSTQAGWTVDDTALGGFSGSTFSASCTKGGTTRV